mgnify:CR=1 FL=1
MNLPLRFSNLKPKNIKNGYSFVGTVSDALQDLAVQYDFEWSIQNGEIQILTKNSSTTLKAFLLSAETGLIESPNRTIKNKDFEKKEIKLFDYGTWATQMKKEIEGVQEIQNEAITLHDTLSYFLSLEQLPKDFSINLLDIELSSWKKQFRILRRQ